LVLEWGAPTAGEPARTAAGAATATLARPAAAGVFGRVDAARGADVRAADRGARECAVVRGDVAEADSDGVDPSVPESASAAAGA
jgi:hypothetical protein